MLPPDTFGVFSNLRHAEWSNHSRGECPIWRFGQDESTDTIRLLAECYVIHSKADSDSYTIGVTLAIAI